MNFPKVNIFFREFSWKNLFTFGYMSRKSMFGNVYIKAEEISD